MFKFGDKLPRNDSAVSSLCPLYNPLTTGANTWESVQVKPSIAIAFKGC